MNEHTAGEFVLECQNAEPSGVYVYQPRSHVPRGLSSA